MARLAQAVGGSLVSEVVGFEQGDEGLVWRRPIFGGKLQSRLRVNGPAPVVVSVQSGAFSADEAVAFAERNGLGYRVAEPKERVIRPKSYSDNFRYDRVQ